MRHKKLFKTQHLIPASPGLRMREEPQTTHMWSAEAVQKVLPSGKERSANSFP